MADKTTSFLVPAGYGEAELIEKRSRFIGHIWPVESESDALGRISETRIKHSDATHNVYAYILQDGGVMRFSDDGEPGGTSGMPTLNVLKSENLQNACCVITRYFGGIKLGAGGLVRAYSAAAKLALAAAGIRELTLWLSFSLSCPYPRYGRVKRLLEDYGATVSRSDFGALVELDALIREEMYGAFAGELAELSAGDSGLRRTGSRFL